MLNLSNTYVGNLTLITQIIRIDTLEALHLNKTHVRRSFKSPSVPKFEKLTLYVSDNIKRCAKIWFLASNGYSGWSNHPPLQTPALGGPEMPLSPSNSRKYEIIYGSFRICHLM